MSRAATTLQRALELARSGLFFDVAAIVEALRREGFEMRTRKQMAATSERSSLAP
jgi:hypothetical protein